MTELTLKRAKEIAIEKGHKILSQGKLAGHPVFYVTSRSGNIRSHVVTYMAPGYRCDQYCKAFKENGVCSHIGCVSNYVSTLSPDEKAELLKVTPIVKKEVPVQKNVKISETWTVPSCLMAGTKKGFSEKKRAS